jgi:eukaryotic-like serine/threonine-protein kinase
MGSGRIVDRYELVSELASGGMATVYLGRVRGAVGFARTVAIKRLHKHLASDREFVAMFLDEGRLASRIRHPNVVPTLDVVSSDGELFLVMEYVHGETLSAIVRAASTTPGGIPLPVAAAIASATLLGLHAAHEATDEEGRPLEVVHRDVSPQNIMVSADGVVRLVDFGVSKATGRLQGTGEGQIKGKLSYMAPESFGGNVDRRGDVYAAAVVLWELVTGTRLFTGSHAEILAKVLAGAVESPASIRPDLAPGLEEVVMCGIDLAPERRFPTARAMERALRRATTIASTFEVAEWLDATMGASLRERAALVASAERVTRRALDPIPELGPAGSPDVSAPVAVAREEAEMATLSATASTASRSSRVRRGVRRAMLGCALAVVAGLAFAEATRKSAPIAVSNRSESASLIEAAPSPPAMAESEPAFPVEVAPLPAGSMPSAPEASAAPSSVGALPVTTRLSPRASGDAGGRLDPGPHGGKGPTGQVGGLRRAVHGGRPGQHAFSPRVRGPMNRSRECVGR